MKDNVNKQLSYSYRQSLEIDVEQLLEEKESKEPSAKKLKLDTNDIDLNSVYWKICICNTLLAATEEQPIAHHHLKLLKHGSDSDYQFMCEVSKTLWLELYVWLLGNFNKALVYILKNSSNKEWKLLKQFIQ